MASTHGIVQVYTGNGKGKTTAAWGQAMRAVGQGLRVAVVRFLKPNDSGELHAAKSLGIDVFGFCTPYDPTVNQRDCPQIREDCRHAFDEACALLNSGKYDMVVLDEINMVLHYDHIDREEMLVFLSGRPDDIEIVLTGRNAPEWLVENADLVTEMREIKHHAAEGCKMRKGIEY